VVAFVAINLFTSTPLANWAACLGGVLQGALWGIILFGNEALLDSKERDVRFWMAVWAMRVVAFSVSLALFAYALAVLLMP
jgi:hypothetical protein